MADLWPTSLPQQWEADTYGQQAKDVVLRSQMDAGPEFTRPRATAIPRVIECSVAPLTSTQVATLEAFYDAHAAVRFQWVNSVSGATRFYVFRAPPAYANIAGGTIYRARLQLMEYATEFGGG
jgi:hypothetical protein